jgi:hypothetical protein
MEKFVDFASGEKGRSLRMVVGALLLCLAIAGHQGSGRWVLGILGGLLVLSGLLKVCAFNLLVGRKITSCPN